MKLTLLGTGTSHGVPVIACDCAVCRSKNKKDKRNRSSAYVQTDDNKFILIDISPEFRIQAIENKIKKLDMVLLTHDHADHLHGIDDLRNFSSSMYKKPENPKSLEQYNAPAIPICTNQLTAERIKSRFPYLFMEVKEGGGHAKVSLEVTEKPFDFFETKIIPVPMMHGHLPTTGWLLTCKKNDGTVHSIAYLTDCSYISDESIELIKQNCGSLDHLVIDGLRIKPHSTHFCFMQALEAADKIAPKKVWMTHLTHESNHKDITKYLYEHKKEFSNLKDISVLPAYDGLTLEC